MRALNSSILLNAVMGNLYGHRDMEQYDSQKLWD
jgi:hypothetical protein